MIWHISTCRDMSVCVGVFRGLSGFVEVCRGLTSLGATLCLVCVRMFVCGCFCRGLSGFVEPGGYMMPAFVIVNCTLYLVNTAFCL